MYTCDDAAARRLCLALACVRRHVRGLRHNSSYKRSITVFFWCCDAGAQRHDGIAMSNNSSNTAARGNVDRGAHRGSSGSSVTLKQRLPQPDKKSDGTVLDECRHDQHSISSAFDSFSSAPSLSLADEVEVARSSENISNPNRDHQQQLDEKTRGKKHGGVVVYRVRRQLPLSEVVSRRAFECVVGTDGEISKLVDVAENDTSADDDVKSQGDHHCAMPKSMDADINVRRASCERSPTPAYRLETLPYGAGISIGSKVGTGEETRP